MPARLVHDNEPAVWLLVISLCGLGVAFAQCLEHHAGVLHQASRGHRFRHSDPCGNVARIIAPWLTGAIAHRVVVRGRVRGLRVHPDRRWAGVWLLMNDMVGAGEQALMVLSPAAIPS